MKEDENSLQNTQKTPVFTNEKKNGDIQNTTEQCKQYLQFLNK